MSLVEGMRSFLLSPRTRTPNGCKILFEEDDTLTWTWDTTSLSTIFDVVAGSEIEVEPGFSFLFSSVDEHTRPSIVSLGGALNIHGTALKPVIFRYINSMSLSLRGVVVTFDYVDFVDPRVTSTVCLTINVGSATSINSALTTLTHLNTYLDSNTIASYYTFALPSFNYIWTNYIMSDIISDKSLGIASSTTSYFISGLKLQNTAAQLGYGATGNNQRTRENNDFLKYSSPQSFATYKDCIFQDCGNNAFFYQFLTLSKTLFYNCTWEGVTLSGTMKALSVSAESLVMLYNNTFTNCLTANLGITSPGKILFARKLTVTVYDENSDVYEGAVITCMQSELKEMYSFITNSNGVYLNEFGIGILLSEKELLANTPTYTQWSDSIAGGRFHTVIVSAPGYNVEQKQFEMTADRTWNVYLQPLTGAGNVFYDSTLNDLTIN